MSTFRFDLDNRGNTTQCCGTLEFDKERACWKASILVQRDPEIRVEAWSDWSQAACLLCIGKFCGLNLAEVPAAEEEPTPA